jgi:hypothetical protein
MVQQGWGCLTLPWGYRWGGAGNSQAKPPKQKSLICMDSFSRGRREGDVGRVARNQGQGKVPRDWKFPCRGSQSSTLVLEQISCEAVNP